jgi:hypothetical protein
MSDKTFDRDQFIKKAAAFGQQVELEEKLGSLVVKALAVVGEAAVRLVAVCREGASDKGPVITTKISETMVQVSGGGRNLVFAMAQGIASDHRLQAPRAEACGQVLVFTHLTGEAESHLLTSMRVYENGECTDGELTWSIESGADGFLPYLAHFVRGAIFHSTVYWPVIDEMPFCLQKVPVYEDQLHEQTLKKPCVGFECNLKG